MLKHIRGKVESGERITREEGLYLLTEANLLDLAPLAQRVRFRHNPDPVVTFVVDTNLNYTNVCDAYCTFCSFYRTEQDPDKYTSTVEEMMEQVGRAAEMGTTTVLMQGGLNPALPMEYYEELVRETRRRFPHITPHYFSAPEVQKMAQVSGLSLAEVLQRLKDAGQVSIPGGGSEILSDRVKHRLSRLFPKGKTADWLEVHRQAHRLGIRSTATMMYGHLERPQEIIDHLEVIRDLQDEHHGFTAFVHWSYKRQDNALASKVKYEAGPNPLGELAQFTPKSSFKDWITCSATSPDTVYLGTRSSGLLIVKSRRIEVVGENRGAPANNIPKMVWMNGHLYLGLIGGIVRYDPTGKVELIASSKALQPKNVFDGGKSYHFTSMVAGPDHNRLWFTVNDYYGKRGGGWTYDIKTRQFNHISL